MHKTIIFTGFLACFAPCLANGCWYCLSSKEQCEREIEKSRQDTAALTAQASQSKCAGKAAGELEGIGISTAGNFSFACTGQGNGCMIWLNDDLGRERNQEFPLGAGNGCQAQKQVLPPTNSPSVAAASAPGGPEVSNLGLADNGAPVVHIGP